MRVSASLQYVWVGRASVASVSESATVIAARSSYGEVVSSVGDRFIDGRPSITRWRDGECRVYLPRDAAPHCADCDPTTKDDSKAVQ
jgi:hypothetical protein